MITTKGREREREDGREGEGKREEEGERDSSVGGGEGRRMTVVEGGGEKIGGLFLTNLLKISA